MVQVGGNIVEDLRAEGWWFEVCYRGPDQMSCPICGVNVMRSDALVAVAIPKNAKFGSECETLCLRCYRAMVGGG